MQKTRSILMKKVIRFQNRQEVKGSTMLLMLICSKNRAIPSMRSKIKNFNFLQDNSPVHTSNKHSGNRAYDLLKREKIEYIDD